MSTLFSFKKRTNQMVVICISEKSALDSVTVLEFYCTFPTLAVPAGLNTFLKEDLKITFRVTKVGGLGIILEVRFLTAFIFLEHNGLPCGTERRWIWMSLPVSSTDKKKGA